MKLQKEFRPNPTVAYLFVTGATFLWGASTVVGRAVHQDLPPIGTSFWRWFLAALVLLLFVWRDLPRKQTLIVKNFPLILLLGILQVGSSALLYLGLNYTTAISATLINASQPALTVIPAWLLTRDRVTFGQSIGIIAALLGIIVMVSQGNLKTLLALQLNIGDIFALLAIVGWAIYATLLHRLPEELGFGTSLFVIFLSGSLIILPFYFIESAAFRVVPFSKSAVGIIIMLGIVVSLGSVALWNSSLRAVGPNRASIFLNLIPVFGVSLAIIFLGEKLSMYHFAGAGLVGLGIILVVFHARRK